MANKHLICVHVKAGKKTAFPEGFEPKHTVVIEPKKGKPYFAVLMSNDKEISTEKLTPAIGYRME